MEPALRQIADRALGQAEAQGKRQDGAEIADKHSRALFQDAPEINLKTNNKHGEQTQADLER